MSKGKVFPPSNGSTSGRQFLEEREGEIRQVGATPTSPCQDRFLPEATEPGIPWAERDPSWNWKKLNFQRNPIFGALWINFFPQSFPYVDELWLSKIWPWFMWKNSWTVHITLHTQKRWTYPGCGGVPMVQFEKTAPVPEPVLWWNGQPFAIVPMNKSMSHFHCGSSHVMAKESPLSLSSNNCKFVWGAFEVLALHGLLAPSYQLAS